MLRNLFCILVLAISIDASATDFQSILNDAVKPNRPGLAALVSHKGEVVFSGVVGLANIELSVPLKTDSVFGIGSITKQFTAAAVLILEEDGLLSLDDSIQEYIPNFPVGERQITIRQLLTHTSGLGNYTGDEDIMDALIFNSYDLDQVVEHLSKIPSIDVPGRVFNYSNTGYVLLGKIIEVASGMSYEKFVEERIFLPLGMKHTTLGGHKIIENRANGYHLSAMGRIQNAGQYNMNWVHAAGGLFSNVNDLNIWFQALRSGKVVSKENFERMITPVVVEGGYDYSYGYGLELKKILYKSAFSHGGAIAGYLGYQYYIPEYDLYVVTLSNYGSELAKQVALKLGQEFVSGLN